MVVSGAIVTHYFLYYFLYQCLDPTLQGLKELAPINPHPGEARCDHDMFIYMIQNIILTVTVAEPGGAGAARPAPGEAASGEDEGQKHQRGGDGQVRDGHLVR